VPARDRDASVAEVLNRIDDLMAALTETVDRMRQIVLAPGGQETEEPGGPQQPA